MSHKTDSSALDAVELQQQLDQRNQLVNALTERLEVAAEQLDRIKRSGGDRGGRVGGGGLSTEALAQQQSLIEQVTRSVELWDGLEPRDAFQRIEERLDELRDMLQGSVLADPEAGTAPPKTDPLSGWEKMKAQLMGDDSAQAGTTPEKPAAKPAPAPTPGSTSPAPRPAEPEPLQPLADLELPEPVDFDVAEREELEAAIEARDQYISYLTRRLRSAETRTHQPIDWELLKDAPNELRESLQRLESELEDRLRIAEVDLSLERARLSRVETRVRTMQQQIEKRLQAAGHDLTSKDDKPAESKKGSASKSWFGVLGR